MFQKKKKIIIKIGKMSCEHCGAKVRTALTELTGVQKVKIDLFRGEAIVKSSVSLSIDEVKNKLESLGYQLISMEEE